MKFAGLGVRAAQLAPTILAARPRLAVSHVSRGQLIVATALRIPTLFICDYEFSTTSAGIYPGWFMCPELIPASAIRCDPNHVLKYPGIKEDVYVPRFTPQPGIRARLGLDDADVVVTVRPPATDAHYHNPESTTLFEAFVGVASRRADVKLVVLPRNPKQGVWLRDQWPGLFSNGTMRIPDGVVDGLNLMWYSDLVVSGGGTMNREAAALGVPVYSLFRGKIGAVDQYLSRTGRMTLIESVHDVQTKLPLVKWERPKAPGRRDHPALHNIVMQIIALSEKSQPQLAASATA